MDLDRYPLAGVADDLLLIRLMEECGEVVQAASKCLRFGPASRWPKAAKRSNAEDLFAELKDVEAISKELRKRESGGATPPLTPPRPNSGVPELGNQGQRSREHPTSRGEGNAGARPPEQREGTERVANGGKE